MDGDVDRRCPKGIQVAILGEEGDGGEDINFHVFVILF
jgi:hypothetical protein